MKLKTKVKLPLECPLHPLRDLFAPRHDAKKRDRPTQWTCRLCGKSFYQEKFLDLHFENRHAKVINEVIIIKCFHLHLLLEKCLRNVREMFKKCLRSVQEMFKKCLRNVKLLMKC